MSRRDRVMIDIETLGLSAGSTILSIGACRFSPGSGLTGHSEFYTEVCTDSCREYGLTVDQGTLEWWEQQDDGLAPLSGETALDDALASLSTYLDDPDEVWANSPSFDCELLEAAYDRVGMDVPWEFYNERCVRTVRSLPGAVEIEMDGREHHGLDDAKHQAREVAATLYEVGAGD